MMLQTLLPGSSQRNAFAGSAIGALLPLIGLTTEALSQGREFNIAEWSHDPSHAMLLVVPILAGMVFYWFGETRARLDRKLKAHERAQRDLIRLTLQDRLTGLPNRRALEREINRMVNFRGAGSFRPALLVLDLNKFKFVNDTLGHDAGDELLRQFADRLRGMLGPLVSLYRLGGDEFVVILLGSPADNDIDRLCHMLKSKADEAFELSAGKAVTGVSIGVSYFEGSDKTISDVLKRADLALYASKKIPGSSHAYYSDDLVVSMMAQKQLEQEIARGLRDGQFFLEYQPIVEAGSGVVNGVEALVRWQHPSDGILSPGAFLVAAERTGHIMALGRWVIDEALRNAMHWPAHIGISVNVSGSEFRDPRFVAHVRQCLEDTGVAANRLTIEVTESIFAIEPDALQAGLEQLRSLGVRIAIDDFGIGFASIDNLRRFPVDAIKVDRSYTQAIAAGGRDTELVELIVRLGKLFKLTSTIEGVETKSQLDMAIRLGAAAIQGFHISRPVSADTVRALINGAGYEPQQPALLISA